MIVFLICAAAFAYWLCVGLIGGWILEVLRDEEWRPPKLVGWLAALLWPVSLVVMFVAWSIGVVSCSIERGRYR